ncbi:uncharacterized protein LOC129226481 [Uloborus diversus]|uniref:uncharacterized protein LOC129226481 n=1 Tax=Uloborus diversus TaxID=327109 RepID=UPI00240A95BC|nr:uncharacterized protein LOC129226481 [Uloborus diversus]
MLLLFFLVWTGLCSRTYSESLDKNDTILEARQIQDDNPCNCYFKDSCGCICARPISWTDFQILPQNFRPCRSFTLALRGGQFHSFPGDYFYRVGHVQDFVLDVGNVYFQYLNDPDSESSPYNGINFDVSAYIRMQGVSVNRRWNWGAMYWLAPTYSSSYCEIQVVQSTLPLLERDFGRICQGAVTVVNIRSSGMLLLDDQVFAPFYKLTEVDLSSNRIEEMRRSYFSYPANELEYINLANNDIRRLPDDIFYEMPSLQSVDLRGNPILSLSTQNFKPTFRTLEIIGLENDSTDKIEQEILK